MTVGRRILGLPFLAFGVLILSLTATPARADPCEGRLPSRAGEPFSGTVRYVGDGDGLCVGRSGDPDTWIEVRLADFDAPELNARDGRRSKALLEQVAMGQPVTCEARRGRSGRVIVYDRVIAVCRVRGRPIGDLLRALRAPEGGN
ncbi:nuclease [Phenylobacterium sp.]|uniref:thermonuclease family protein n=1 Tax=Phenylobacterium sp. TaxID=1871053 RepID=UPI00261473AD|nr:nuclease [Phenylobacterium sp.]